MHTTKFISRALFLLFGLYGTAFSQNTTRIGISVGSVTSTHRSGTVFYSPKILHQFENNFELGVGLQHSLAKNFEVNAREYEFRSYSIEGIVKYSILESRQIKISPRLNLGTGFIDIYQTEDLYDFQHSDNRQISFAEFGIDVEKEIADRLDLGLEVGHRYASSVNFRGAHLSSQLEGIKVSVNLQYKI